MTLGTEVGRATRPTVEQIERVVALAVRAPSIHNTQPWRFVFTPDALEVWADRRQQLAATDLDGWALSVSCGGAVYLAVLGLAGEGWRTTTERLPDPGHPDLLARVRIDGRAPVDQSVRQDIAAAGRRHTERRPFRPDAVSVELLDILCAATDDPSLYASVVLRPDDRLDLAVAKIGPQHHRPGSRRGHARTSRHRPPRFRPGAGRRGATVPRRPPTRHRRGAGRPADRAHARAVRR